MQLIFFNFCEKNIRPENGPSHAQSFDEYLEKYHLQSQANISSKHPSTLIFREPGNLTSLNKKRKRKKRQTNGCRIRKCNMVRNFLRYHQM